MMKVTCKDLGKMDCHFEAEGMTASEVEEKMMNHAKEAHPDVMTEMGEDGLKKAIREKMTEM